jgi:hypothetical protein
MLFVCLRNDKCRFIFHIPVIVITIKVGLINSVSNLLIIIGFEIRLPKRILDELVDVSQEILK